MFERPENVERPKPPLGPRTAILIHGYIELERLDEVHSIPFGSAHGEMQYVCYVGLPTRDNKNTFIMLLKLIRSCLHYKLTEFVSRLESSYAFFRMMLYLDLNNQLQAAGIESLCHIHNTNEKFLFRNGLYV